MPGDQTVVGLPGRGGKEQHARSRAGNEVP